MRRSFADLVEAAERAPIRGWDFSWLDGRASEDRPPWRYRERVAERLAGHSRLLDLQSGGGEMLSSLDRLPPLTVAAEGWAPNLAVAAQRLRPLGAHVIAAHDDRPALPFGDGTFDLVTSRHPIDTWWDEVARVLSPGGRYLSQQVGPATMRELREFLMGPQPESARRSPERARDNAQRAGLRVEDLQSCRVRATFDDIGAVVYFLRLVIWSVPDFTVEKYRDRLHELHRDIEERGPFIAHATRFLLEATKPG